MSNTDPGKYPLTESEKAELKRRAREAAAEQDKTDPEIRSGGVYDVLARAGTRLTGAGEDPDAVERELLQVWAPTDLKVMAAIATGQLTREAWNEMGPAGREKLFKPRGFSAWERGRTS